MTTVSDVLHFIEALAPPSMQESWDNVGLLLGNPTQEVRRVLVALDAFEDVATEAIDVDAQLIVTHHPLIFDPPRAITTETTLGRTILQLARHGVSAINAHTNLDCAPDGVNDCLAQRLGLADVTVLDPMGTDDAGRPWGLIRWGSVPEQPLEQFLGQVKTALGCPGLRYVSSGKPVRRVAVGGGSCGSELEAVAAAGCDTFVTADIKYNRFWDAKELRVNLIDAGHFWTENPVCAVLQQKLAAQFPNLDVILAKNHTDAANFF